MISILTLAIITILLSILLHRKIGKEQIISQARKKLVIVKFSSLPLHYSYCLIIWSLSAVFLIFLNNIELAIKTILSLCTIFSLYHLLISYYNNFNAKKHLEKYFKIILLISASFGIIITIAIMFSIVRQAFAFFEIINFFDFILGTKWNPQVAINSEQNLSDAVFGALPVLLGTLIITLVAIAIAIPIGIMGAINLCFYCNKNYRNFLKPTIEILAGVPTVVYGYFAAIFIGPMLKNFFANFNVAIEAESALAAGIVMGVMIIPFILSLTDDAIRSVPKALQEGALAMGSTKSEMICKVIIPAAMPNIAGAIILAISRAIGETMIVVMAAGLTAKMTINPLNSVTTATAQIVSLLTGDQHFNSPKTLAAFALAFILFTITFGFNILALSIIKNYKKKHG